FGNPARAHDAVGADGHQRRAVLLGDPEAAVGQRRHTLGVAAARAGLERAAGDVEHRLHARAVAAGQRSPQHWLTTGAQRQLADEFDPLWADLQLDQDRKSTRLNSSHSQSSYAV